MPETTAARSGSRKYFIIPLIFLFATLFFFSCNKEGFTGFNYSGHLECHRKNNYDTASISDALLGSWKWQVHFPGEGPARLATRNIKIEFRSDKTFTIVEGGSVIKEGIFRISQNSYGFELLTVPLDSFFGGILTVCSTEFMCQGGYMDGPGYMFVRNN